MGNSKYGLLALAGLDGVGRKALRRARKGGWTAGFSTWHVREIQERLGVTNTIAEQIKGDFSLESGKEKYEWLTKRKIHLLAYNDAEYPAWLREIADPPELLYAMGKLESLSMPAIALVGTRNPTVYGKNIARQFGMELAKRKWAAISGLARGIDGEAHRGAVEANGVTIAVLGCGIDQIYPKENEKLAEKNKRPGAPALGVRTGDSSAKRLLP
ncbi:DNA-processing protein DprA [Aneurinibacillus tyrosinisolvens]|uniref:DNA-processing protein DprA n=1 Tax=Aneurinibacillus tyrosinisolvens TaxID=1443435 RepID=UPI00069A6F19|nr:DNA-processing protein DprA [Aneurinibacillus tyrosinisolvens]